MPVYLCHPVFLQRQGWEPCTCSSADLFETTECHGQAGLYLHLPEFSRLVWQHLPLLPKCPPLPGQQWRGADASQKPLHQCSAWRMPGQCSGVPRKGSSWTELSLMKLMCLLIVLLCSAGVWFNKWVNSLTRAKQILIILNLKFCLSVPQRPRKDCYRDRLPLGRAAPYYRCGSSRLWQQQPEVWIPSWTSML